MTLILNLFRKPSDLEARLAPYHVNADTVRSLVRR